MAVLVLQDDQGTAVGANAYIDVPFFTTYHTNQNTLYADTSVPPLLFTDDGLSLPLGGFTQDKIAGAIVRATAYLDKRFDFIGWRRYSNQPTAWPRWDAVDINDRYLRGIPLAVQQATAEYAFIALTQIMVGIPTRDPTGQTVRSQTKKVSVLETSTQYAGVFQMPKYPVADAILASWGLIVRRGQMVRG